MTHRSRPGRVATASVVCAAKLVGYGVAHGLAAQETLEVAGITGVVLSDPEARLPVSAVQCLWEHVLRRLDDPAIPIRIAQSTSIEDHDVMGLAILTSESGADALQRALRYSRLFTEAGDWRTRAAGRETVVEWVTDMEPGLGTRAAAECAVAEFVHAVRLLLPSPFVPSAVFFTHPPPSNVSEHERFFGCTVRFGARASGFRFDRRVLDLVHRTTNPALSAFVVKHADRMLMRLAAHDTVEGGARSAIALELAGGGLSLAAVARRMNLSERSLRRRLEAAALSFRELVDSVRHEHALELLVDSEVSLKEVSFLLGFSEPSAFSRAFRRWTGTSPRATRDPG